jgi:hypothetical protein
MHITRPLYLRRVYPPLAIIFVAVFLLAAMAMAQGSEIKTSSGNLVTRVAPGELLPVQVKLTNFGGGGRVDVTINYHILDENGNEVVTEKETVAVETTASFIKIIQIPRDVPPGKYTTEARITYQGQKVPATANYQFTVERKIAGMFVSQFLIYGAVTIVVGIMGAVASRLIKKKLRVSRLAPHEYPEIPKEERIFYEIISDIIAQMRYRVGDKALDIAKSIDDLSIDKNNGKVLQIKKSPTKIIALLILKYEKLWGQKVSFAIRRSDAEAEDRTAAIDKNLVVIRKYFEPR